MYDETIQFDSVQKALMKADGNVASVFYFEVRNFRKHFYTKSDKKKKMDNLQ